MFVDAKEGSDWNSGMSPDQPLKTIAEAINKIAEDRTGVREIFIGPAPKEKEKKQYDKEWPPEADNLNEEWWK